MPPLRCAEPSDKAKATGRFPPKIVRRRGVPWRGIVIHGVSLFYILWIVVPFSWVVLTSLMTEAESMSVPPHWIPDYITFDNYLSFINPALLVGKQRLVGGGAAIGAARAMLNSSIVALSG